jgi:uncharacterized membrane protein
MLTAGPAKPRHCQAARPAYDFHKMTDEPDPPPLLELTLYPHRSLSPEGFWLIMGALVVLSFVGGVVFWSIGAWPVIGFIGLDVALVYWAFKASYAAGRAYERVILTEDVVVVRRVAPSGRTTVEALPAHWLRVELAAPAEAPAELRLSTHGRALVIGAFLSPAERREVATALREGLARLRAAPAP